MEMLINTGQVLYTEQGLTRFVKDRTNYLLVEAIKSFLKGRKLFEKDDALKEAYYHYLTTNPAARASLMILKHELSEGRLVTMNDMLRGFLE